MGYRRAQGVAARQTPHPVRSTNRARLLKRKYETFSLNGGTPFPALSALAAMLRLVPETGAAAAAACFPLTAAPLMRWHFTGEPVRVSE